MTLLTLLAACSGSGDTDSAPSSDGACGEPSEHSVVLVVKVVDAVSGDPVDAVDVVLDDRGWTYEDLGSTTTGVDGVASLALEGVTDLPDCWGTVLDYVLEVSDPTGFYTDSESAMNNALYNGIHAWGGEADMTASPIELDPA